MKSDYLIKFLLTFGFLGYFPIAPGTIGSVAGVILGFIIYYKLPYFIGQIFIIALIITFTILGAYLSGKYNQILFGKKDPSKVVIDEVAGVLIAISLPNIFLVNQVSWIYFLGGFLLFRFFDITKILGIKKLEKIPYWNGGWGVMLDDTLAGLYSFLILLGYQYWIS